MARTVAGLPARTRLTAHISLGVLTAQFPLELVHQVLFETERCRERDRNMPAHVMVYSAIARALHAEVSTRKVSLAATVHTALNPRCSALPTGPFWGSISGRRRAPPAQRSCGAPTRRIDCPAADAREPVVEHAAGEERVSDLRDHGAPWAILARHALVVDGLQALQMIRHQPKQRRGLRAPGLVDATRRRGRFGHARSGTEERQAYGRLGC